MKKLHIVQGLDTWYPDVNGPEIVAENYCKILNRHNDCRLFVPSFGKKTDASVTKTFDFEIARIASMKAPGGFRCALPLCDKKSLALLSDKIDILHAHSPFTIAKYFNYVGEKRHIPTVLTFHTKFKDEFLRVTKSATLSDALVDYIIKVIQGCDNVWTVSNGAVASLREYGYSGDIKVIRNGTDMTLPQNPESLIEQINKDYNLHDQPNVFLFVGRIVEVKNLPLILNALSMVKQSGRQFKMIFVGDGTAVSGLKKQTAKLGLSNDVIFTGMITDREYLKGFYLRSDLFLFPSVFDTASLVPLEAATFSLPTLLIKDSPTSEIVTDGVNGYAEPDDAAKWAKRIISVIDNPEMNKVVSAESRRSVYRSWEDTVSEVYDQYIEILRNAHLNGISVKKSKMSMK